MLRLIVFAPALNAPSASPFCTKALCLMQMAGAEFRRVNSDPRKTPKSKLPVLHDGDLVVADSDAIRSHLEKTLPFDFDAGLSDAQRAVSRAFIRLAEEHLYFAVVADRWQNDENWPAVKKIFFAPIPALLRPLLAAKLRRDALAQLHGQGMGRHSLAEQLTRADLDLAAIATQIGKQAFLFGDTPTAADASVAAMLVAAAGSPVDTPLKLRVTGDAALMAYLDRARAAIFPQG